MTTRPRLLGLLAAADAVVLVVGLATLVLWSALPGATALTVARVDQSEFTPQPRGGPFFVLVVGNDGRPGLEGVRGDAIHLVGVNPAAGSATILNIPRDTYVPIPGAGSDKINAAFHVGGLQRQVQAVSGLTGVAFSFAVTTNFDGFQALVDDMGGLHVEVPYRMFDRASGADFEAGRRHMLGAGALSFARNRHIPDGDIARTTNQGWLLVAGLARAREIVHSPFEIIRALGLLARHTTFEGVGLRDLYQLVSLGVSIDPANVRNVTMPSRVGQVGPASVVFPGPGAQDLFADFRDDAVLQRH